MNKLGIYKVSSVGVFRVRPDLAMNKTDGALETIEAD